MVRFAAVSMIVLGVVHMFVLGVDLPGEMPRWFNLNLWTFDHWQPVRDQDVDLALSNAVFWATMGSFALPIMLLGVLILWLDKRGLPIPPFVGWAMVGWFAIMTLLMPPSGFPVGLAVALLLATGLTRRARA